MTKRLHKSALITLIMLLLCALSMLCAFGFTGTGMAKAANAESAQTTEADDVLVFDDLSYFNTKDNGDGTYTISGGEFGIGFPGSVIKNGLSTKAYCELLSLDSETNTLSYQALLQKVLNQEASGKQFQIVIPSNVSKIEDYAFVLSSLSTGGITYCGFLDLMRYPALVEATFAKNESGSRAITADGFGSAIFGLTSMDTFVVPKEFESFDVNNTGDDSSLSPFYGMSVVQFDLQTEKLTKIPERAFEFWMSRAIFGADVEITSLDIPEGVIEIGARAYKNCVAFIEMTLPDSLKKIGNEAFYSIELERVSISAFEQYMGIEFDGYSGIFSGETLLYINDDPITELVITGVEKIQDYAFSRYACTCVEIKSDVKEVGVSAFADCSGLNSVVLPDGIKIGNQAFADCSSIQTLDMPKNAVIGSSAFEGCSSLARVYSDSWESWCSNSFTNNAANPLSNGADLYIANERKTEITIPVGIKKIPDYGFVGGKFTSVDIQGVPESIGNGAFYGCSNITDITIKDGVRSIGHNAFERTGIAEIKIPNSVTEMGWDVFRNCTSLQNVILPNSLTEIRSSSFEGCTALKRVMLPSSVRSIGNSAFKGCTGLQAVSMSSVTQVGNGAFNSCTSLTEIVLAEGVTELRSTFNGCTNLRIVYVPSTLSTLDAYVFKGCTNVKVISPNKTSYDNIHSAFNETSVTHTYPVHIRYMYKGVTVDEQTAFYRTEYDSGLPAIANTWYSDAAFTNAVTAASLTSLLATTEDDEIVLYAESLTTKMLLVKSGLVYDGESYSGTKLNELLRSDGDSIEEGMATQVIAYTDADGVAATDIPSAVCNAGIYTVRVSGGSMGVNYTDIEIRIARRQIDLADYTNNLSWKLTEADGTPTGNVELLDGKLYVYAYGDGERYASLTPLDTANGRYQGYVLYSVREVKYSVVRYRGENKTVKIEIVGDMVDAAYTVTYSGNTANDLGMFTATATLTPTANYELVLLNATDLNARGLTFTPGDNGGYTVSKEWYVVEIGNWLVSDKTNETEYAVPDTWTFGTTPNVTVPYVMYGDVETAQYGSANDPLGMTLYLGDTQISGTFNRANMNTYLNAAMPAGNYRLVITVRPVMTADGILHSEYEYVYRFTVTRAALPATELDALNTALKNQTFSFDYDNALHLVNDDVRAKIDALRAAIEALQPYRSGTVWDNADYDAYYGNFRITYNIKSMGTNAYFTENDLSGETVKPVNPGKYTVYYLITANNFDSLVAENMSMSDYDAARRAYMFYTVIIREVEIPIAQITTYNGEAQKADIPSSEFYTVNDYNGFTNAGEHNVTLTLVNSEYYRWKDKALGEVEAIVKFVINQAVNDWIEAPDIIRWVEGKYNEEENTFIGAAKFGEITYMITDADDNVLYDAAQGINKLASLKAGKYFLRAHVAVTDNYTGLSEAFTIRVLEKIGLPWWGTLCITLGALLIAAIIILILWKKGVFQILTGKIVLAIRTRASVDATIASVRAAKRMEEGKKSVAEAKHKERMEEARRKAEEERALPPEERAAIIEAKAQAQAEKAEKMRLQSEAMKERAKKVRGGDGEQQPTEPEQEAATADDTETPTEE